MKNKTWNEFWGEFLQVTFHEGHPDLWPSRQKKALWAQKHFQLPDGSKILDLGCGDGKLDICFSQMGFDVTAVDRNKKVLQIAQATDDKKKFNLFLQNSLQLISSHNHLTLLYLLRHRAL